MLVAYQDWRGGRNGRSLPAKVADTRREKMKIKA
jgi:hypothetical protein